MAAPGDNNANIGNFPRLYGRRKGHRLRKGRQNLIDTALEPVRIRLGKAAEDSTLDGRALFSPPPSTVWLEVGFGGGEHLAALAAANPELGFIGCEPYVNGTASLLSRMTVEKLRNIRIFCDDARQLLAALAPASLGRVYLLFPDPWPKRRHAARRFVSRPTMALLARVLIPGGEFRLVSDDMGYIRWSLGVIAGCPDFEWLAEGPDDWRRAPPDWTPTRYQKKARAAGRAVVFLRFRRCQAAV